MSVAARWTAALLSAASPQTADPALYLQAALRHPEGSAERAACVRTWASVAPAGTTAEVPGRGRIRAEGRARLFGRVEAGTLRVRVTDPQGVVGRVGAAWLDAEGRWRPLPALGRARFRAPPQDAPIRIRAHPRRCAAASVLLEARVAPARAPSEPPDLAIQAADPPARAADADERSPSFGPVWLGLLVLTVVGVSLGAWDETRERR